MDPSRTQTRCLHDWPNAHSAAPFEVQLSKQTKLAAESQQALANREAALLDAANLQRVTKADTLRHAPLPAVLQPFC